MTNDHERKLMIEWLKSLMIQSTDSTENDIRGFLFSPHNDTIYKQTNQKGEMNINRKIKGNQEQLDKAVLKEDYEMAALFRDELIRLESVKPTYKELMDEKQEAVAKMEFERAMEIELLIIKLVNPPKKTEDTK